jgi:hypothetical protein
MPSRSKWNGWRRSSSTSRSACIPGGFRPGGPSRGRNPTLNHFCIEITKDFDLEGMASIALHELTHSLYELSPMEKKQALMQMFVDSSDASAQPLYMFMNEALATGVQLLLLERNGRKDDDPYHDPFIPRLGQAALPLIRQALESKTTLFDGFASRYIVAGRKALDADADRIRLRFSCAAVLGNSELTNVFFEQVPMRFFVTSEEERKLFARLNTVRVLTYEEAGQFASGIGELGEKMRHRGFAYIRRQSQKRQELFLIGLDKAAVVDLAKQLAEWKGPIGEGLIFTID